MTRLRSIPWTTVLPVVGGLTLAASWGTKPGTAVLLIVAVVLIGAVLAGVHHAQVVAHPMGEPFGSLILAVAVTVIEVGLIVTLMVSGGDDVSTLARDTVFAAAMITCNGIVGLSLLIAALREHVVSFRAESATAALSTVATLATLTLVLPSFTTSTPGGEFSGEQLAFAAVASLALYGRRRGSRTASTRSGRRRRPSASSSRCSFCCPRRSPRHATPPGGGFRSASTSRSAPPWPASA